MNELILQQIFANLSTGSLLSSCSLVNKTWNAEARTFVRTYRKCVARNNDQTTPCEFLQELDRACGQMKKSGRILPFNHLKMNFSKRCEKQSGSDDDDDEICYSNIISELKIKGLIITSSTIGFAFWDCRHHKPLRTVLKHKSTELRSLKIDITAPFGTFIKDKWRPQFHQLEEFSIQGFSRSYADSVEASRLRWLLKDTPNLKRLVSGSLNRLKYVPKKILERVHFHGRLTVILKLNTEELNLLSTIADKASGLTELIFYKPPPKPFEGKKGNRSKSLLERLLQSAQQSLKTVKTDARYPLSQISHPRLINLSNLGLVLRNKKDWNDIASIDFEHLMPQLKNVSLIIETKVDCSGVMHRSSTVRELNLTLKNCGFDLHILGVMFPNVSVLNLHLKDNWPQKRRGREQKWGRAPVREICLYWQHFEKLKITGSAECIKRNYDEEFCGLFDDEVKHLAKKNDDYLKKVHIVPRRPCLLTLPSKSLNVY